MALHKVITNEKGVTTEYHRIEAATFEMNRKNVLITVYSYTNADYRQSEIQNIDNIMYWQELGAELSVLYGKGDNKTEADEARITQIEEERANIQATIPTRGGGFIQADTQSVTIPFEPSDDMSMSRLYTLLKEQPQFEGAEDC